MKKHVAVIDYGAGNLKSVVHAFNYLGAEVSIVNSPNSNIYSHIILPGVGSFRRAMQLLRSSRLDDYIKEQSSRNTPILGICLGMQLLASRSSEDGETLGLNLISGDVDKFSFNPHECGLKIPHVGFSSISTFTESRLFLNMRQTVDFYFTHSYRLKCCKLTYASASAWHGEDFVPAIEYQSIAGTQFHPEKSQQNGLSLLNNFLENF